VQGQGELLVVSPHEHTLQREADDQPDGMTDRQRRLEG
jgi:hypothetical protein